MRLIRIAIAVAALFLTIPISHASEFQGIIVDRQTGEPVPGAVIKLIGSNDFAITNAEGEFNLRTQTTPVKQLVVSRQGYEIKKLDIAPEQAGSLTIELAPKILQGQDVIVTADRGNKGKTPATFSNLSHQDISQKYWAQDTPMLLMSTPNLFAYSDAGNGIGYSYLKLRGFDQNRVSVMINGIPLNGAESHEVYWVDLPDFANNIQDIQVQRGVGTSLYGQSALGGTVNMITNDFSATPQLRAETGYGSYDTRKLSISGNSGLINDSYVFFGRFSKINSDGYRDNSWVDMYSYFIGAARYDKNMTWKFNTYGGPEELHLAYKGITEEQLNSNRKYNELEYPNEIDHFNQPHYEFSHDWDLSGRLHLANKIYYFHGEGYYNQYRTDQDLAVYNLGAFYDFNTWTMYANSDSTFPSNFYANLDSLGNPLPDTSGDYAGYYALSKTSVDLIRKPIVKEYDWGWLPQITIKHDQGALTIGGEARIHASHHWGEITWAAVYPNGYDPNVRYHDYRGKSNTFTVYASETYNPLKNLTVMTNLQYQRHNYKLEDDKRYNVTFSKNYDFLSPRAGLIYKFNENLNTYFNASLASRQPTFSNIYDPQDFYENPDYRPVNFINNGSDYTYVGPELKPEKLTDLELGWAFSHKSSDNIMRGELNLYRMQITDELIPYSGQLDDMNVPISGNADKTIHQGIELTAEAQLGQNLNFRGNLSINDDHFVRYAEFDWEGNSINLSGNRIGGFPEMMAGYEIGYRFAGLSLGLNGQYIGKQFIDNAEQFRLDPYHIIGLGISYDFGRYINFHSLTANFRVMNLFDVKYEQAAYVDYDDGQPRYMVGAERNVFLSLTSEF